MASVDNQSTEKRNSCSAEQVSEVNSTHRTADQDADEQRTLWQNIKRYRKVCWITIALTSAILLYGYDNVVVGTVSAMPLFQRDFGVFFEGAWILPSGWLAAWNVASPLGAMAGSLGGGWLNDKIGRRRALGMNAFLAAIGVAIMYVSYLPADINGRRVCFMMGKFFQGIAIGGLMSATQTYMSEILPPVLRGSGMALFPAITLLGQLTGAAVIYGALNKDNGYAVVFGSQWPFSAVPMFVAFLIPESPAWYVRKREMEKAHKAQARLDPPGVDTSVVVAKILATIEHEELSAKSTFVECFHKRNIRRTFIVMWANTLTNIFGLNLLGKASYFLQLVGMKANLSIIFLILGIVLGLIANVISIWIMSRVGRRTCVLSTLSVAVLLWASMGIANSTPMKPAVTWYTAASMMMSVVVCGIGVWPASYAISAETSSLQLRSKTQGIGWATSAFTTTISGLVLPYVFNPDEGNLRGKTGYTYAGACFMGVVVSYFLIPEMKGRTINEIDRMFELKLKAREFKHWAPEGNRSPTEPWV
ncbi:MFS general substrate transporter [Phaeosphaeriaceae sp. SRC1lsM3a]|nr:MFS general substrate transporter [Stagonospora sp. SRC1lsM3a]